MGFGEKKTNGTPLTRANIGGALADLKNDARPACPARGAYGFGRIGEKPACSLAPAAGHAL